MYAAFLSYSRSDSAICARIHRNLESLGRPFFKLRGRRIFHDVSNAAAADSLERELTRALESSRRFVLLASPRAAASSWVDFEVRSWLARHEGQARDLLILLCDGSCNWNASANDFDWSSSTAVPKALSGAFSNQPLYCDIRGFAANPTSMKLGNTLYRDRLAEIAAPIDGRSKEELVGHHLAVRRKIMLAATTAAVGLAALGGSLANRMSEVNRQTIAEAARLRLAQAGEVLAGNGDPNSWPTPLTAAVADAQAALRELQSLGYELTSADEARIRAILDNLPAGETPLTGAQARVLAFADNAPTALLECGDKSLCLWNAQTGQQAINAPADSLFSPDLRAFAWTSTDRRISIDIDGVRRSVGLSDKLPFRPVAVSARRQFAVYADAANDLRLERLDGSAASQLLCRTAEKAQTALSNDEQRFAALCEGELLRVWSINEPLTKGQPPGVKVAATALATFANQPSRAQRIAFSADGSRVALATELYFALWTLAGKPRLLVEHNLIEPDEDGDVDTTIADMALDPAGVRAAFRLSDDQAVCIDALGGEQIWPRLSEGQFADRGRYMADPMNANTAHDFVPGGIALLEACSGRRISRVPTASEFSWALHGRGARQLAVSGSEKRAHVVDLNPRSLIGEQALEGEVRCATIAAAAPVAAGATASLLRVWDMEQAVSLLDVPGPMSREVRLALSDDGSTLTTYDGTALNVWSCLRCAKRMGTPSPHTQLEVGPGYTALSSSGAYVLLTSSKHSRAFHLADGVPRELQPPPNTVLLAITEIDGQPSMLLADPTGRQLSLLSLHGGSSPRVLASNESGEFTFDHAYTPIRGKGSVLIGDSKGRFSLAGGSVGETPRKLELMDHSPALTALSDDNRYLAVATDARRHTPEPSGPGKVEVIDLWRAEVVKRFDLPTHVALLSFRKDGSLLVAANSPVNGEAGYRLDVYEGNSWPMKWSARLASRPESVAHDPDSARMAVGLRDGSVVVISASGELALAAPQHGRVGFSQFLGKGRLASIGFTAERSTLRVVPDSRKALADRLLTVKPSLP